MKNIERRTGLLLAFSAFLACGAQAAGLGVVHFTSAPSGGEKAQPAMPGDALVKQGQERLDHGEFGSAIESFGQAIAQRPDGATYFLLGYAHYARAFVKGLPEKADKKDAAAAADAFAKSLAADPWMTRIQHPYKLYHAMGLCYEALGQNAKAVAAYDKAIAAEPGNAVLPLYPARLWLKTKNVGKATAQFRFSLENAKAGGQDLALARMVKASPLFAPMLANPSIAAVFKQYDAEPAAQAVASAARVNDGELRDSVRGTTPGETAAPAMRKADQRVYDRLGQANDEFAAMHWQKAITAYNDSLTLSSQAGTLSHTQTAFIDERIGACYNKLGQSAEAEGYLAKSLELQPMSPNAHYQLALAYAVSGRYEQALKSLDDAFQAAPGAPELKRYLMLAKTDSELDGARDLTAYRDLVARYEARFQAAK